MPSSVLPFPYRGDPGVRGSSAEPWLPEHPARVRLLPVAEVQQRIDTRHHLDQAIERHGYAPPARHRLVGLIGTTMVFALVLAGFAVSFSTVSSLRRIASTLTMVELRPYSPSEATTAKPTEVPPGPEQHEQKSQQAAAQDDTPALSTAPPVSSVKSIEPSLAIGRQAADQIMPAAAAAADARLVQQTTAPPSQSGGNNAKAEWEDVLLSHLAMFRRYPRQAESARQQGIVLVGITLDRSGRLLKAAIRQGSGYPLLDAEALATVRRSSPLPAPTGNVPGDPVNVEIPVQFSLRR